MRAAEAAARRAAGEDPERALVGLAGVEQHVGRVAVANGCAGNGRPLYSGTSSSTVIVASVASSLQQHAGSISQLA